MIIFRTFYKEILPPDKRLQSQSEQIVATVRTVARAAAVPKWALLVTSLKIATEIVCVAPV